MAPLGLALALVGLAAVITHACWPYARSAPFAFFYLAILCAAIRGGAWAGALATALSLLIVNYFFLAPLGSFALDLAGLLTSAVLGVVGACMVLLVHRLQGIEVRARAGEARLSGVILSATDAIITVDQRHRVVYFNASAEALFGRTHEQALGAAFEYFIPAGVTALLQACAAGGVCQTPGRGEQGQTLSLELSLSEMRMDGDTLFTVIIRNISERLAHEAEIERLNRLYGALSHVNQALVRANSRDQLFHAVCDALVERGGFCLAWMAWHDPQTRQLIPQSHAGKDGEYVLGIVVSTDEQTDGLGPSGRAFKEGRPYCCNDFGADPATLPWREKAARLGIQSSAALPIRLGGQPCGTLNVYALEKGFFKDKEMALLQEVAADVSFALDALAREGHRREAEALAQREQHFSNAMIESMPGILYFYNDQGRFLRWNRNFTTASGYSAQEIAHMQPLDFFASAERPLLAEKIAQVYEDGESCVEALFLSKDGSTRPYFFTGKRVMFDGMPCLIGVGIDVTVQKQAQLELEAYARRLQAVSRQLLEVQENERRMLARELHDSVGQELTALSLNLSIINSVLPGDVADKVRSRLDDSQTLLENTSQHLRSVMIELRPPGLDELGLLPALRDHAQRVAQRSGFVLRIQGAEPQPRLPATTEIALFRIAQEALNNTVKHAQASSISIDLHESQGLVSLVVADDGAGFVPPTSPGTGPHRMGMTTMRERAEAIGARLRIGSGAGCGTEVTVELLRASLPRGLAQPHF